MVQHQLQFQQQTIQLQSELVELENQLVLEFQFVRLLDQIQFFQQLHLQEEEGV